MAKIQDRAKDRAQDMRPYIERAFKDERVREDVKSAVGTAREIYEQLMGGRQFTAAAARVATDKEIQESSPRPRSTISATPPTASRARARTPVGTRRFFWPGSRSGSSSTR